MGMKPSVVRTCEVELMAGPLHFSDGMLSKVYFNLRLIGVKRIISNCTKSNTYGQEFGMAHRAICT